MWFFQAIQKYLPIAKELADQVTGFCIDSRKVTPGSLFFALRGERVDGHDYLKQAAANGAIAALVDREIKDQNIPLELIYCRDVREALQSLAKAVIDYWKPKIIAVTGSLGKTSTKDFILAFLKSQFAVVGTPGNYNSQLTLPLTILNVKEPTEYLVLEMGIDRPGEMDRLLDIANPDYAILTMLAHVHVEPFNDFENLANEKMKIFGRKGIKQAFYNLDMPFANKINSTLSPAANAVSYSLSDRNASYFLELKDNKVQIFQGQREVASFISPFFDHKSHYNLLGAISIADTLGVSKENILNTIPLLKHASNRLEKIEKNGILFVCDAYNSNLESAENALMAIQKYPGRKIAIISDMIQQGQYHDQNHYKLAELALKHADCVIGFGSGLAILEQLGDKNKKRWAFFLSYESMLDYLMTLIQKGDVVLIKGSRKKALERIIHDLDFDALLAKTTY